MSGYDLLMKPPFFLNENQIGWVRKTIGEMSLKEKVGQLFCLDLHEPDPDILDQYLQKYHMGGFMVRQMPLADLTEAIGYAQGKAAIPLLVSANLESGGDGMICEGVNVGPCLQVGATGNAEFAKKQAYVSAREGMAAGANYAFAPVVDIDRNFRNPITGTRVYGADAEFVKQAGIAYVKEVQSHGMAAAVKHFPGDGVDERDQHQLATVNSLSCDEWDASYGDVYRGCIEAGALTVMVGHIMLPSFSRLLRPGIKDEEILPATLAPELLGDLLRSRLGFNGLIITDNTGMAGFYAMPRQRAVPAAIAAGCDMLLFSRNLEEDFRSVETAVREGVITRERLEEALIRILGVKAAIGLPEKQKDGRLIPRLEEAEKIVGCKEHRELEKECAMKGITLVKDKENLLPISPKHHKRILLHTLTYQPEQNPDQTEVGILMKQALEDAGFQVALFETPAEKDGYFKSCRDVESRYDLIIYAADLPTQSFRTTVRLEWKKPMGADCPVMIHSIPTIFISLANPYHLVDVPRVKTYINAYKCKEANVKAVVEKLLGHSRFAGKSPVDAYCGFWDTRL